MKKLLLLFSFLLLSSLGWGQGSESFESASLPASYSDGSFVGDNSVTWNYIHSRDDAGYEINNEGILLRRSSSNSKVYSDAVSGGIGDFTCKLLKAYTGSGNRQVELFINGVSKGTSIAWDNTNVQTFTVSGINISGNVTIEIRNITSKQVVVDDISWTAYSTGPTITVTPTSLTGFTYLEGNGPSAEQSFTVEGSNLTNDITVTPPTNWEISTTSGGAFSATNPITLTQSGGTVNSTTIYTRMVSGLLNANSPFSGNISCTSNGATQQDVAVDGTVTLACTEPNLATNISFANITASAIDVSWTASSGGADNYLVVQSTNSSLSSSPADGTTYAVNDALGGGTVVFNGAATSFTDSGLSSNTTYYYYVFAYNDTNCSGGPNYTASSLDGNATTLSLPDLVITEYAGKGYNADYNDEYIELSNFESYSIDLTGWTLEYYNNSSLEKTINLSGTVSANSTYLIAARSSHTASISPQIVGNFSMNSTGYAILKQGTTIVDEAGSSSNKFSDNKNYEFTDCTNDNKPTANWDDLGTGNGTPGTINCQTLTAEIEIQGNATEIVSGDTTPDVADDTDFGTVAVAGGTVVKTFTIKNTGGADLNLTGSSPYVTISGTNAGDFSITANPTTPISASGSTTFSITFDPSALGTRTATISIANDDTDENPYTFAIQGEGTNSNQSDIIENTGFSYTINIPYASYQEDPITNTSGSVGVFKFDIRDGGGSADTDNLGTELTDITFSVGATHGSYIRSVALFDGNTQLANNPTINSATGDISFSGLSGTDYTAPDNGTKSLTLRVSFTTTVTDNEQLQFTITSATANSAGSVFATANAGGAQSAITGDKNRIEVNADRLAFGQQPTNTNTNATMNPAVTVKGVDTNGNLDLDFTDNISISSSGTMNNDPITNAAVSGVASFNNIVHTLAGTSLILTASHSSFTSVTSNTFDIIDFVFESGDFRPTQATTFASNGQWEYYDGSSWGAIPDGNAPQNTTTTINRILIDKWVGGAASASTNYNCNIIVQNTGTLEIVDNDTPPVATEFLSAGNTLEVENGGSLIIRGDIDLNATTNFILRDGAEMIIDQNSMVNNHPMWDGVELFEGGSTVEIRDWDWTASAQNRSLINVVTTISDNANGYKFGKVYFNPTNLTDNWTIVGGSVNANVTENDFEINNTSSFYVLGMSNKTTDISSTYGGNIIVHDGNFTFGGSFSTDTFDQDFTINGNVIINNDDNFYLHHAFNGTTPTINAGNSPIKIGGKLEVWGLTSAFTSDVDTKEIIFTSDTNHTIEVAPNCSNIPMIVEGGDSVTLLNENLKFTGNSSITIQSNATFNFGFNGTTALEVQNISGSANKFIQEGGAYLYITHPQGIWDASSNGNVQDFAASNITYTQANSTYHYIGKTNQETGDAFTAGSTSKTIICELENNTDELTVTATTGTSSLLEIRKGIVVNTEANHIYGSGNLTISDGGLKTSILGTTSNVPILTGTFNITGGFIELNAAADQVLRGTRDYRDLTFSDSGTKTISSAISTINGDIYITDAAILNVENKTMGGAGTDLLMDSTAEYITAGINVKPDAQGLYQLDTGTKITFTNNAVTLQRIRLNKDYYNIDIVGTNVGTNTLASPIEMQSGSTFTVKDGATFKHSNTTGFNGSTNTAINNANTPNIVLEANSTIEYQGANQIITPVAPHYANVIVSGTGITTIGHATDVVVNEDLTLTGSTILIETDKCLTVSDKITNNTVIEIENEGSLVQINETDTNDGVGTYKIHKKTKPYIEYDYTYWSSPVQGESIGDVFNTHSSVIQEASGTGSSNLDHHSLMSHIYWFDTEKFLDVNPLDDFDDNNDDWIHAPEAEIMPIGRGYIAMGAGSDWPFNTNFATKLVQSVYFESNRVHNGSFTYALEKDAGADAFTNQNLVGNPYASAIDLQLLRNNAANKIVGGVHEGEPYINSTALFWSHDTGIAAGGGPWAYNFTNADYATLNIQTGIGTAAHPGTQVPTQYLASCQSIMLELNENVGTSSIDVTLNNASRVKGNNNNFFKQNEKDVLWLKMTNPEGLYRQLAVVFMEEADNTVNDYDSERVQMIDQEDFYTMANSSDKRLVIQGLAPFTNDKVIPIGIEILTEGIYVFDIDHTSGLMNSQTVYIMDLFTNTLHNLTEQGSYKFVVTDNEVGILNNRFELRFVDETASVNENKLKDICVYPNPSSGVFTIATNDLATFQVYNINGKLVLDQASSTNTQIDLSGFSKGIYFAKILIGNQRVVKKLVLK